MVIIQYSVVSSDTINALVPAQYFKKNLSTDSQHEISDDSVGINWLSTCKSLWFWKIKSWDVFELLWITGTDQKCTNYTNDLTHIMQYLSFMGCKKWKDQKQRH